MSFISAIHDPLVINLRGQTRILLSLIPSPSHHATDLLEAQSNDKLLRVLSRLLAIPAFTLIVASLYRPILLDLCARWLEDQENTEDQLAALCLLIEIHEELFPILYRLLLKPPFKNGPLGFITLAPSPLSIDAARLHRLLLAHYRILQANRELPRHMCWPLTPLSILIWTPHLDNGVRLLSIRCYALQSGMGEAERENMEREVLGEACGVDCQIEFGQNVDGTRKEVDGWILPVIEMQRVKDAREDIIVKPQNYYTYEGDASTPIDPSELSPLIANIYGVLLLRAAGPQQAAKSPVISTPTTVQALQSLALHVSLCLPTLLTSPPSSGKSLFLSHLAELLHPGTQNQIITIHLADTSLDPRALLGSYISSPTQPGSFEWKEGVLVRSMREGKWVVFEDVDRGSSEVLGVIKPLVESLNSGKWIGGRAFLDVPSRGRVVAHDAFALFATRSIVPTRNGTFPPPIFFGAHKFYEVVIQSPSTQELRSILDARFPRLSGSAALAIVRVWESVKALGPAASTREVGLRELEKFCTRVQRLLPVSYQAMDLDSDSNDDLSLPAIFPNPTLREDMYIEARDIFFGAGTLTASARAHVEAIAQTIGERLGLDAERRDWVLRGRTPDFELEKDVNGMVLAVRIGRSRLPARVTKLQISPPVIRPFAMHRPAILLLSRIATAVSFAESVLLTGETGTGKTSIVTHLASLLRRPLISLNLSHQTESSDLLGGFKPVDARTPASALQERFLDLFGGTFSRRKNEKFEAEVRKAVGDGKWKRAIGLWKESSRLARDRIRARQADGSNDIATHNLEVAGNARKRRKVDQTGLRVSEASWALFVRDVEEFEVQHVHGKGKFAFGFVEGPLVRALRSGDWILLDEINLASPETLECISGLLHGPTASITLTEQGSLEPVPRHPDFRLFACMNPATDVGKKDLPPNIRSRFTEIDVPPPDADKDTLLAIITQYIGAHALGDKGAIMNVAEFYSAVKDLAEKRQIADGSNHRPHFSIRTLARALTFAADMASTYGLRRSIWEGCLMAFTMVLDSSSAEIVTALAQRHLLAGVRNPRSMLGKEPSVPHSRSADEFVKFGPFYLEKGHLSVDLVEDYIMTPSVETKLVDLARIILTRRFPILIEGPTSSGKTSSVEYLAMRTGHRFVRINNHEHTDIQEYIGSYISDPLTGKLVFKDGLLVRALRNGDWIVLDELNLAPTDVLEALNRLLDDNRELLIPETQEVVRPHPHFMLFATQNPPGLYAGRKVLSRAFRNRFLEVHFEDVPQAELETILCQRCRIAPSYGKRIVGVFHELQKRRQSSRVFESKQGFATLRDLFRWAGRDAVGYQELADNGYMLLAERARRDDDKAVVKEVIESVMGVKIDESAMYNLQKPDIDIVAFLGCPLPPSSSIVWTSAMQRLFTLVSRALRFNEPVLLVGETGSGKTSVCQAYAEASAQQLHGLNCHQNTETADLIGGLRPVRNRSIRESDVFREVSEALQAIGISDVPHNADALASSLNNAVSRNLDLLPHIRSRLQDAQHKLVRLQSIFEWHDGPLVEAMRNGDVLLLDEISLADDSVLERLNSVLEPARTIVLAERGGDNLQYPAIRAADSFKLVATMNPGGDYGKKELSPALRNRFTEIWVPSVDGRLDLELIIDNLWKYSNLKPYTACVLDFLEWLCTRVGDRSLLSLRDILAWVMFTNSAYQSEHQDRIPADELFHHAAHMTFLDGLGSLPQLSAYSRDALQQLKDDALSKLQDIVPLDNLFTFVPVHDPVTSVQFGSFAIPKGPNGMAVHSFNLQAPTTRDNAMRVVRACQVLKPILLEGSPGVGKTSLVAALANISGHELCRINLSDQTDLIDLFGSDLPVEGGGPGEFAWKDAEFLKALQEGHWVLLDEMNLAPQAVLEGLNAVLDHRGTVYIPELGRSFIRHPSFRIFAAQNPLNQGGGRKGLPKSFVNRFTKVYIEELSPNDLLLVCQHIFPDFDEAIIRAMISFNTYLNQEVCIQRRFAREGGPWEFNLRDVIRWGTLLRAADLSYHPAQHIRTVYLGRFRTEQDRNQARLLFNKIFSINAPPSDHAPNWSISSSHIQVGHFKAQRQNMVPLSRAGRILKMHLSTIESIGHCVSQSWLAILTGPRNSGKTDAVRVLAHFTGNILQEISVNSATDTMDILGSFEQVDMRGRAFAAINDVLSVLDEQLRSTVGSKFHQDHAHTLRKALCDSTPLHILLGMASKIAAELNEHPSQLTLSLLTKIEGLLADPGAVGLFEWVDGPLLQAMKNGHWLLMDGANLCNPSVLDRLNSLCEPDGFLTLSERGYVDGKLQLFKPHRNFRLFMTVDPQYGELSRAMRNRGVEIALITTPVADDPGVLLDYQRLPWPTSILWDPKPGCIAFDATRRGILLESVKALPLVSTSGRSFDQQSGLSSLVDQAPMIATSTLRSTGTATDALLFFLARTIAPAYTQHFNRFLASLSENYGPALARIQALLNILTRSSLATVLSLVRERYIVQRRLPSDLVVAQPMDFYLTSPSGVDNRLESDFPPPHHFVLQTLDLAVALFLDEDDTSRIDVPATDKYAMAAGNDTKALQSVASVLKSIYAVGCATLDSMDSENWIAISESASLAFTLLKYSRYLRRATANFPFDFSAVQAISRWITEAVKDCPPSFVSVAAQAQALNEIVSLSSGLGLIEIWSALFIERPPNVSLANLAHIDHLASCINHADVNGLRRQSFDFMALQSIPATLPDHANLTLLDLKSGLEQRLLRDCGEEAQEKSNIIPSLLIAELRVFSLYGETSDSKALIKLVQEIVDLACEMRGPLLRIVPYQHLAWAVHAKKGIIPALAKAQMQWLHTLWNISSSNDILNGPSMLLHPTQLKATIQSCDSTQSSLHSLESYESEIRHHLSSALLQCGQDTWRLDQLAGFLYGSISLITACFASSYEASDYNTIHRLRFRPETGMATSLNKLLTHLEPTKNIPFKSAIHKILGPLHQQLRDRISREKTIADLGSCWIAVGSLIIDLFVPNAPVDPAAIQNCTTERWCQETEMIEAQLRLHHKLEELSTGNSHNDLLGHLKRSLDGVARELSNAPSLPVRKDLNRLHMFWSEVSQFQAHILSPQKIDELLQLLQAGDEYAMLREQVVQQSMAGFYQRLDTVYTEYIDLSFPLQLAILHIRMGLRLVAHSGLSASSTAVNSTSQVASAIVAFPSVCSTAALSAGSVNAGPPGVNAFRHLLLTLSAIAMERSMGVSIETHMNTLELTYGQALRLWLIDRAKENDLDEASRSLYRRKNLDHDAMSEAEMEEQEFLALFPSFEDALEQELQPNGHKTARSPVLVQPIEMHQLASLHNSLLDPILTADRISFDATNLKNIRESALKSLLDSHMASLPDTLDNESLPFQLSLFHDALSGTRLIPALERKPYNFYVDPNVAEVKKAATTVVAFKRRLKVLIQEWPDQMVLQHLEGRCDVILDLNLHSPVAKILSALEQLLLQTEDWEIYSNRENTLKQHQQALISLIVEWRRLELSCWQVLLESQATAFAEGVSDWWFRLYDATVRGPLDALDREENESSECMTQYIDTLIPLLDDFIRSSPLGQFQARMRLLRSFLTYLHHLGRSKPNHQSSALDRIQRVLHATERHFSLFSTQLSAYLADQRALLEKEIRGFIKLASWKDVNVQALKQSAQRTHHQLYKIIRKFRDVLRQPISERLHPQLADVTETKHLQLERVSVTPSNTAQSIPDTDASTTSSSHLLNLTRTFVRFNTLVVTRIRPFIYSRSAHIVDNLAVDVIVTAKELAAISVPSNLPPEKRDKQQKALLVRKRKAWSDLLKELKRAGFATNVKPEILRQHTNPRWLREQPIMPTTSEPAMSTEKSEVYFARLHGSLPELRSAVVNHHSDLTTRELQRGIMLLESAFSMTLDLRSRLSNAFMKYLKLEQMSIRLRMLSSTPKLAPSGPNLLEHVLCMQDLLCRLSSALQELRSGMKTFNDLQLKVRTSESFMEDVGSLWAATGVLQERLELVADNLRLTTLPVLLESEHELIAEVQQHFSQTVVTLRRLSLAEPRLSYLFRPVEQWLSTQGIPPLLPPISHPTPSSDTVDLLINSFLITVQAIISNCPDSLPEIHEEAEVDHYILHDYRVVRDFTHLLNIDAIMKGLDGVLLYVVSCQDDLQQSLQRILPFFETYMRLVQDQLATHSQWMKALFKLDFVLCSVMHTLCKQGFCKPPDADETGVEGDASEIVGGVGLGEGSGSENVSKDIEDESQVEGLQGEDVENQDAKDDGDTDAIEMSEDVGGNMEDVPDNDQEDDSGSDGESDVEPEERLGALDASDPSAIDEKLWGDEKGPQGDQMDEKIDQDRSEGQTGSSDVVARERDGRKQAQSVEKSSDDKEAAEERTSEAEEELMSDSAENEDENNPNASGAPMDEYIPDANTMDLPDDIDLGGDDDEQKKEDMGDGADEEGEEMENNMIEDTDPQPGTDNTTADLPDRQEPSPDDPIEQPEDAQATAEDSNDIPEDDTSEEPAIAQPDVSAGQGSSSSDVPHPLEGGENPSSGEAGSSEGAVGADSASEDKDKDKDNDGVPETGQAQLEPQSADSQSAGSAAAGSQEGYAPSQQEVQPLTNPLRSLGDSLKEIRQRFDDILGGQQKDSPREHAGDTGAPSQVEYLQPEDADHDMQALGPAGEEQVAKLNELKLIDGEDQIEAAVAMDVDFPQEPERHEKPSQDQASQTEQKSVEQRDDIDGAILQSAHSTLDHPTILPDPSMHKVDVEMEDDPEKNVEVQLRDWQTQGFPEDGAGHVWRLYESLTHDLAYALCEQLRLILEPTLATRLKGDYRTGKRLNMKKIISYIASDYTKDKIWLRRTRPSQREYQVLIAIDDSRSMAESHSVHLAYETLALVSKALSRLEAGDIAIAKFGEHVDMLHGFDQGPFTDQAGTRVMNAFRFNQKATNVLSLVDTSLRVLETARDRRSMSSATAADLWQLEIIISDGMCQDHDHLRTVLRKAEEQRVMIVFIIIDSLHTNSNASQHGSAQGSILSMDKAEFKNVDGRMELQLQKYLDSFPFEYYVVLRNVEALPEVLAGTLRQFFERISEE